MTSFQSAVELGLVDSNEPFEIFSVTPTDKSREQVDLQPSYNEEAVTEAYDPSVIEKGLQYTIDLLGEPSQQASLTQITSIADRQIILRSGEKIDLRYTIDPLILKFDSQGHDSLHVNTEAIRAALEGAVDLSNVESVTISSEMLQIKQKGQDSATPVHIYGSFAGDILKGATFTDNALVLESGRQIPLTFNSSLPRIPQERLRSFVIDILARSGFHPESVTGIVVNPLRSVVTQEDGFQKEIDTGLLRVSAPNLPRPSNR